MSRARWQNTRVILDRAETEMLIRALDDRYAGHPDLSPGMQTRYNELVSKLHDAHRTLRRGGASGLDE